MGKFLQPDIYQLLRSFRHDLLNELQLLLGHIQLGRSSEVIYRDVEKIVSHIQAVGSLFACQDNELATLLWHWQRYAQGAGIDFQVWIEPLPEPSSKNSLAALLQLGQNILDELHHLQSKQRFLYIKISSASPRFLLQASPLQDDSTTPTLAATLGWQAARTETDWRFWSVH